MARNSYPIYSHEYFMAKALDLAIDAFENDEVPVGAIVVAEGKKIIGKGVNQTEQLHDVTAHAEILALTAASNFLGAKYLKYCTLYVTLEPCVMCAGALHWVQLQKLIYGADDEQRGYSLIKKPLLHPKTEVLKGIAEQESKALLAQFFKRLRE